MKKKNIVLICSAAAVSALALVFVPRDITVVTSSSSFIFSSTAVYDTNPVLKIKVPSVFLNKNDISSVRENNNKASTDALNTVIQNDSYAFRDELSSADNCACEVNGNIYYYRFNDTRNVYKLDKTAGEISSCPLSGYNSFTSHEFQASYDEVDHNFAVFVNIKTEALIDSYPELRNAIESKDGHFYCSDIYYEGGRIFFLKNDTLYEFIPKTGKAKRTASIKDNIELIVVR